MARLPDDIRKYYHNLKSKDKKKIESFTYHCTTEPIHQKRYRALVIFCENNKIETLSQFKELYKGL